MCGEYRRCCLFGGQRDVKGALQEGLSVSVGVCVRVCGLLTGAFPGSAQTIRTEEDVLIDSMGIFGLLLCNCEPENPANVPLQWSFAPLLSS